MDLTKSLRGIVTVLNTPFTAEDGIDVVGLQKHVRYALDAGVAGFLVPAMASEVGKLNGAERRLVLDTVVEVVAGAVPVIGGASAEMGAERVARATECMDAGCAGVLVALAYGDAAQYEHDLREVAALAPEFLMVQDWDSEGYGAPVELIARLFAEVEVFKALKVEVVDAGRKYTEVLAATQGHLHVSGGWAVREMLDGLARGVHAFMPTGLHRSYCEIYRHYGAGDVDGAKALFARVKPVLDFSNQHLDVSIHFFKQLLHAQGVYATDQVREPIMALTEAQADAAARWVDYAMALEEAV